MFSPCLILGMYADEDKYKNCKKLKWNPPVCEFIIMFLHGKYLLTCSQDSLSSREPEIQNSIRNRTKEIYIYKLYNMLQYRDLEKINVKRFHL